jgi:hypothetical protein
VRVRRFLDGHGLLVAAVVYAAVIALCALAGYWLMFSQYAVYDDEGFFDYSVKLFAAGHPLYSSVFSDYGPFYYLIFGGLFSITGHGVTTDAGRLIQLAIWLMTSLGIGLTAHRLTGRLTLGVASLASAFLLLNAMTSEPMHPGALICLVLTLMAGVGAFVVHTHPRAGYVAIGAAAAALLMTKINVGGYAVISIAFAAVMASWSLARCTWLRRLVIAAFVLVGPAIMATKLNQGWARSYAFLAILSTLSLAFVSLPGQIADDSEGSADSVRPLIAGFVVTLIVILSIVMALGTGLGDLINQILLVPSRQGSILVEPINLDGNVIWWSLAATGAAWTWRQGARGVVGHGGKTANLWQGLLRTVSGLAILLSLGSESIFNVAPNAAFSLAMPLAWVAALPSRRDAPGPRARFVRLLIPSLAVLQALLAFPVAGSQVLLGSILLVLCGVICLADGWADLVAYDASMGGANRIAAPALGVLFVALAVGGVFTDVVQPLEVDHDQFRGNKPLTVPGATRLRLNELQGPAIDQTVALLRSRCRTLIGFPGMYSFNIWTGLPSPSAMTGEQPYWRLLSHKQEISVLRAAVASPGLCAVRNDTLAATYGGAPTHSPIVSYIDRDFVPIASYPPYTVEVRR